MSGPVVSLLGQYKSFVAAAHKKLLIANLQQGDARALEGLAASLGVGMLSYLSYSILAGRPVSERPQDWLKEGISRSGITGWFSELNSVQAKFFGGKTDAFRLIGADAPLSRRATNSALADLLGPTYSKLEGLSRALGDSMTADKAGASNFDAGDVHRMRQVLPLQNLWLVRKLFNQVEIGADNALGIKPLKSLGGE